MVAPAPLLRLGFVFFFFLIWDCVFLMGGCIRNTIFGEPKGIPVFFSEGVLWGIKETKNLQSG